MGRPSRDDVVRLRRTPTRCSSGRLACRLGSLVLLAALTLPVCSSADDPPATRSTPTTGQGPGPLAEALADLEAGGFSGVVLVDDGGEGDDEGDGPGRPGAGHRRPRRRRCFDLGSLTKQLTATAILRLEADGLLSVDDPVGRHLDGLTPEQERITLHQLLTHTAGLPEALGDDGDVIDRQGFIDLVAATPLDRPPGQEYAYSNVGYSLLAAVIEVVTGRSYDEHLQEEVLEPAGLTSTGYRLPDLDERDLAVGYDGDRRIGRPTELPWADDGPYWHLRGNGGILSTAEDVHRWHLALLGDRILDDASPARHVHGPHPQGDGADTVLRVRLGGGGHARGAAHHPQRGQRRLLRRPAPLPRRGRDDLPRHQRGPRRGRGRGRGPRRGGVTCP